MHVAIATPGLLVWRPMCRTPCKVLFDEYLAEPKWSINVVRSIVVSIFRFHLGTPESPGFEPRRANFDPGVSARSTNFLSLLR